MTLQNAKFDTDVMIVGSGPVGLTLALDLAHRGVRARLIDSRIAPARLPKMERSNPRTMEIYRRLHVVDRIRAAAYPADKAMDCFITASLSTEPLVHLRYASVNEARTAIAACTDGSLPREPYQLVSQYTLEPILLDEVRRRPEIDVRLGETLVAFDQDAAGVTSTVVDPQGIQKQVRAKYLAGCDGGSSTVRKLLGVPLEGRGGLARVKQVFFRSDDFYEKSTLGPGRHYSFVGREHGGAGVGGVIIVQDDRRHFTLQTTSADGTDFAQEIRRTTGLPINVEILYVGEWTQHMMVAARHAERRVFLVGDANHLYIPAGGLGMNTGIGDAYDLGWKLAGVLGGWGGTELLRSYAIERSHVAHRNLAAVQYAVDGVLTWRAAVTPALFEPDASGDRARQTFAKLAEPLNRRVYEMHGAELGYRYDSPIVWQEAGSPPPDGSYVYTPSSFPGVRLPNIWLPDGTALHDRLGHGFTLLKLAPGGVEVGGLERELRAAGVTLDVLEIFDDRARQILGRDLILVRPDQHVCWRGNAEPSEPSEVARVVTGHRVRESGRKPATDGGLSST